MLHLPTSKPTFSTKVRLDALTLGFVQPWPDLLKQPVTRIRTFLLHPANSRLTWTWKPADETDLSHKYKFVPEIWQANAGKASLEDNYFHNDSTRFWQGSWTVQTGTEVTHRGPSPVRFDLR